MEQGVEMMGSVSFSGVGVCALLMPLPMVFSTPQRVHTLPHAIEVPPKTCLCTPLLEYKLSSVAPISSGHGKWLPRNTRLLKEKVKVCMNEHMRVHICTHTGHHGRGT